MKKKIYLVSLVVILVGIIVLLAVPNRSGKQDPSYSSTTTSNMSELKSPQLEEAKAPTKMVALTFDDGPDSKYTEEVLEILNQFDIKGTFFVVGAQVKQYPEILKRVAREGHELGNHSWSHPNLSKLKPNEISEEISSTDTIIREVTGITPKLMRPPYGASSAEVREVIRKSNYIPALWDVDTLDWKSNSVGEIMDIIKASSNNKLSVLMHSGGGKRELTVKALPEIISFYKSKGYSFVTMSQLYQMGEEESAVVLYEESGKGATVSADILNVRDGSGVQFPVIEKLREGTKVNIIAKKGAWYQIKFSGDNSGWVSEEYLILDK